MKIGKFQVVVTFPVDGDKFVAEVRELGNKSIISDLGSVFVENGRPVIEIEPDRKNESGVWKIDYQTFKQIIKELDKFLESIGHPQSDE